MSIDVVVEAIASVYERYGEETLERLLALAPLVAGSGNAWQFAVEAMVQGDDGTLIVTVPGLPGEPPRVTWVGGGWHVTAEPDGAVVDTHRTRPDPVSPLKSMKRGGRGGRGR